MAADFARDCWALRAPRGMRFKVEVNICSNTTVTHPEGAASPVPLRYGKQQENMKETQGKVTKNDVACAIYHNEGYLRHHAGYKAFQGYDHVLAGYP
ncbi:hypothetical protein GUITHDRAFT_153498 [Guillardia theta CCMP2712]|uniref:Uncharacterized protein n=1 Tax=Guillardia theta (strain CCMP2712) TaxID=905079 RepID=L1J2V1_GUITC|nr:hypothetical protein GUITHDRAFT_153498 [Guillardia theta CCMP2712]EKX42647.1 hypothetical protein GUITHDRAFT_153498 [Guillardia theta CCMP2712]|eukprot:XP_005829627.1 hypothetical protein GUITHDRAFT_153498 [Guillardia theta CCMP2712]